MGQLVGLLRGPEQDAGTGVGLQRLEIVARAGEQRGDALESERTEGPAGAVHPGGVSAGCLLVHVGRAAPRHGGEGVSMPANRPPPPSASDPPPAPAAPATGRSPGAAPCPATGAGSARHRDLVKGLPDRRVERAASRVSVVAAVSNRVLRYSLSGVQARSPSSSRQLRETGRVARGGERLPRRPARRLVLAVAVPRRSAEDRDDDLGPEPPDDPHDVLEDRVRRPVLPGLVQRLGVAEVVGAGEVLPGAVEPAGGQQLLGPDEPQRLAQLRPDQVLAALTPVEREIGRLRPHAAHQDGQQLGVLVVGMGADHEHPLVVPEHPELLVQRPRCRPWRAARAGRTAGRRGEAEAEVRECSCGADRLRPML